MLSGFLNNLFILYAFTYFGTLDCLLIYIYWSTVEDKEDCSFQAILLCSLIPYIREYFRLSSKEQSKISSLIFFKTTNAFPHSAEGHYFFTKNYSHSIVPYTCKNLLKVSIYLCLVVITLFTE